MAAFGDGATEEGVYHESLNFAGLHSLPVIFLCENNGLAVHSRPEARQGYRIPALTRSYGIRTTTVANGHDPMQVHRAFSGAVRRARSVGHPELLEILTCRYREHVGPGEDIAAGYRSAEEIDRWKSRDPLIRDAGRLDKYRKQILDEIDAAVAFAETSPWPDESQLLVDVL